MSYLTWSEQTITDFSSKNINSLYNQGFLFTREGKGAMYQTRSLRIDLEKFELSSENRRILKKTENLQLIPTQGTGSRLYVGTTYNLPLTNYDWKIGKMAKDFYETKFGKGTFSANKVKELLTTEHNFNLLFGFVIPTDPERSRGGVEESLFNAKSDAPKGIPRLPACPERAKRVEWARDDSDTIGYCICYQNDEILHYCYPFYQISNIPISQYPNIGMSMMLRAIIWAKEARKKYVYLGSAKDAKAKYKLQFEGLEWFDGKEWKTDLEELKNVLK